MTKGKKKFTKIQYFFNSLPPTKVGNPNTIAAFMLGATPNYRSPSNPDQFPNRGLTIGL